MCVCVYVYVYVCMRVYVCERDWVAVATAGWPSIIDHRLPPLSMRTNEVAHGSSFLISSSLCCSKRSVIITRNPNTEINQACYVLDVKIQNEQCATGGVYLGSC